MVGILLSFPFWGLASFQEVMFLNNDTPIPILLPYHSQREFLQVWERYGKLSFRECTTTLALNSTRKVSPLPWTVVRDQDRKEMKLQMKIMKTENPQVQTRKGLACIYYTEVYTHTQTIFFHHHRWFLSVDPSLKILGNVTVIDSDCRNFTRRSQSWKIDPTFLRNTILCPWQYFLLMMIHWWLRLVAYIPITRTSPINHWMTHDWHFLGTANHHWASMLFFVAAVLLMEELVIPVDMENIPIFIGFSLISQLVCRISEPSTSINKSESTSRWLV